VSNTLLVDTGFWIALFDPRDRERHELASEMSDVIERANLLIPWPIQYETLRTRFVKRVDWVARFDTILKRPQVEFLDDSTIREEAYRQTIDYSKQHRPISMIDM
jgi:predicted nucleic acid-binding protein